MEEIIASWGKLLGLLTPAAPVVFPSNESGLAVRKDHLASVPHSSVQLQTPVATTSRSANQPTKVSAPPLSMSIWLIFLIRVIPIFGI